VPVEFVHPLVLAVAGLFVAGFVNAIAEDAWELLKRVVSRLRKQRDG
jgi:hypothetical protein